MLKESEQIGKLKMQGVTGRYLCAAKATCGLRPGPQLCQLQCATNEQGQDSAAQKYAQFGRGW